MESTISDYAQELTLFGFLNETNQNCVVKYARIPDVDKEKLAINTCANRANYAFAGSLSISKAQIKTAKDYNSLIRTYSESTCYANYKSDKQKMGECINQRVSF